MNAQAVKYNQLVSIVEAKVPRDNEYIGDDGLLYCKVCGKPRQTLIEPPFEGLEPRLVRCWCGCPTKEDLRKEQERREKIERCRRDCFKGTNMGQWDFNKDNRKRPELSDAMRKYAEQFPQYLKDGKGLLLYGDVGTGKSCFAAMIANAVIDQGYTALMTNFENVEKSLWDAEKKSIYMDDLCSFDLLILDDLGAERKNEYMQGIVYSIVDARYTAGKPVIITTNLTTDELAKTEEIGHRRIYDRLLERCLPVKVDGVSLRRQAAKKDWGEMRRQLGMEVLKSERRQD